MRSQTRTSPPRCLCFLGTLSFTRVNVIHRSRRSLRVQCLCVCVCVRNNGIDTPCFEHVLDLLSFSVNKPPAPPRPTGLKAAAPNNIQPLFGFMFLRPLGQKGVGGFEVH